VYVLPEYQGKGLGKWLIKCIDENISLWPELRRALLVTAVDNKFYIDTLGMTAYEPGKDGLGMFQRRGPAAPTWPRTE
jgi:GNAT superfamily N-acetyltransferase